ncbi:uncharacterized protein LOC128724422 [Anopheles nili]|uniref:uncharacterized protein LOC128724422 n=1 Tax=Anopheles nili TaxID=185578 RepID=UPI00237C0437|nr:uncharacterized protein LOC128724422 [Anopheles nili]
MDVLIDKFLNDVGNEYQLTYYTTELQLYFEKHHIFEILFDLMLILAKERPLDIKTFIAANIISISKKYSQINTFISVPDDVDTTCVYRSLIHDGYNCPVIEVNKSFNKRTGINRLKEWLKNLKLDGKNLIMIGNRQKLNHAKSAFYFRRLAAANDEKSLQKLSSRICENSNLLKVDPHHFAIKYAERIVLLGRPGCGKHRIGKWLAERLNVILVSASELKAHHERQFDSFGRALSIGSLENLHTSELISSIVQHRLLQLDCLNFGWVLIDYPNTADDVKNFYQLMISPKKVIFLNTDETICRRRKLRHETRGQKISDCWKTMMLDTEMIFYDIHYQSLLEAFQKQEHCAILQIDGNRSYPNIQKSIVDKLMIKHNM